MELAVYVCQCQSAKSVKYWVNSRGRQSHSVFFSISCTHFHKPPPSILKLVTSEPLEKITVFLV